MKFVLVTGLSGAGRSTALRKLEDLGYFCVDNLMPALIPAFARSCMDAEEPLERIAATVDSRLGDWFSQIYGAIDELKNMPGVDLNILFMDAADDILVRRFKSTRRPHPVSHSGEITEGIHSERRQLQQIKDMASRVIDTSYCSIMKLSSIITSYYSEDTDSDDTLISVISFGYKRGIPLDADMVFDTRFLPNPFYVDELRPLSGQSAEVREYVFSQEGANEFIDKLVDMVCFTLPMFFDQDKKHLIIGIGCTGGMHRSVAVAERLAAELKKRHKNVYLEHRDMKLEKNTSTEA